MLFVVKWLFLLCERIADDGVRKDGVRGEC